VIWINWLYRYLPKGIPQSSNSFSANFVENLHLFIGAHVIPSRRLLAVALFSIVFMNNSFMVERSDCPEGFDKMNNFSKPGLNIAYYMGVPWALPNSATFVDKLYATLSIAKILLQSESKCVRISDARVEITDFNLNGFTLEKVTDHYNWEDAEDIETYLSDIKDILKKRFPEAKAIECGEPTIRGPGSNSPIRSVHFDYWSDLEEAKEFGSETVADFLELLEQNNSTEGIILGVWKPIRHVVEDDFLALLDVQSFDEETAMKVYYDYPAVAEDGHQYQLRSVGGTVIPSILPWFGF